MQLAELTEIEIGDKPPNRANLTTIMRDTEGNTAIQSRQRKTIRE
jgi:arsenate reductase-like glutaredoxin family protein